jgi:hypothetical protein
MDHAPPSERIEIKPLRSIKQEIVVRCRRSSRASRTIPAPGFAKIIVSMDGSNPREYRIPTIWNPSFVARLYLHHLKIEDCVYYILMNDMRVTSPLQPIRMLYCSKDTKVIRMEIVLIAKLERDINDQPHGATD